jgi:7-cyano-7-deazaguanine synthase
MSKALVVLSGGIDSTTALALAIERDNHEEVAAITFDYGQRHNAEINAAKEIAALYGIRIFLQAIPVGTGGVLMQHDEEMPHLTYEEIANHEGPSPTYVPFRNACLLSQATSHAIATEYDTLYAGMHAEDAHNWAYPDCTPEFLGAMQNAIYIGSYMQVRLVCPFTYLTKAEVIAVGIEYDAPYHLTLSCYEGRVPPCAECPTCVARARAFAEAGFEDPLYRRSEA